MYIGWTGRNATHNLNLMTYDTTANTFGPAQVLTDTTLAGSGPSLTTWNGNLYVAWLGTDNRLNIGRYNPANPSHLANKVTLSERSNNAPSITVLSGRLYLSWRGTDGRLNIISSADAKHFGTKVTYAFTIRTSPSLSGTDFGLFVAWENVSASSHIAIAYYNPLHPTILLHVVTLASTSQLPVSIVGDGGRTLSITVAWRTASDAHIHVVLFLWSGNKRREQSGAQN